MAENANEISEHLNSYLRKTSESVQVRRNKALGCERRKCCEDIVDPERKLECLLFRTSQKAASVFRGCKRLIAYQIPMMNARASGKWGKIDLLGISENHSPVVIELKQALSNETPLRAIVEAAAYAVALRKNWDYYAEETLKLCPDLNWAANAVAKEILLVVQAPVEYWQRLLHGRTPKAAFSALDNLANKLSHEGYPVRFSSIVYDNNTIRSVNISKQIDESLC